MPNPFTPMPGSMGMQKNMLRDYMPSQMGQGLQSEEVDMNTTTKFPSETPLGMAYVPFQSWEEPYDVETAFPIGTIFPVLDFPFRGGGPCA